jgi:Protein of unknown function (DUF2934)
MDSRQIDLIRARAHQIWENEGRPEGMHGEHWKRAEAEVLAIHGTGGSGEEQADAEAAFQQNVDATVPATEHFDDPAAENPVTQQVKKTAVG